VEFEEDNQDTPIQKPIQPNHKQKWYMKEQL
jgi:hypothetical protein